MTGAGPSGLAVPRATSSMPGSSRLVLAAMTSTMVLLVLDSSIVGVMLPSIARDLSMTGDQATWLVSAYLLTLAVFLPLGGRLSDALGAVRLFVGGMVGFVGASVGVAVSRDVGQVIAWRAVAGVAGAMLMPATMSIITATFADDAARVRAMATYTGVGQGFALVGPAVGGVCAQSIGWQWGFLVNVPVGLTGVVLVLIARPDNRRAAAPGSWDLVGLVLLLAGLTLLMLSLIQGGDWGWAAPATLIGACTGLALLAGFVAWSWRRPMPLLQLRLFRLPIFSAGSSVLFALGFAMTIASVYGAVMLQETLHLRPAEAGAAVLPMVVPLLITTKLVAGRADRLRLRAAATGGAALLALGLAVVAIGFWQDVLAVVCVGMVAAGVGIALVMSPVTSATVAAAPEDLRGQAAGISSMTRQVGGIVGVGMFGALLTAAHAPSGQVTGDGAVLGFLITAAVMAAAAWVAAVRIPAQP